ncbi:MarR family transcriptional regulator [Shimia sp.]|uniref:MarR family winged helix-turn-helix transcriptional regulator n=1 Tax=Shimia sp. TaxID=1954381 RepID=UPI0032989D5F
MTFDRNDSPGYLANHMARLFANGLAQRIQDLGLAPAQFMVLLSLWEQDGVTQKDLVADLEVEQATMANTLGRMERDGLIERRPSATDKRARIVSLTSRARALEPEAKAAAMAQNALAMSGLDAEESAQFVELMRRVVATMQRAG